MQQEEIDELYNEIYGDEEADAEEEYVDDGISDIQDDEEYEEKMFYQGFPDLEDIYYEKIIADHVPSNYDERQQRIFKQGLKKIQEINEKYGCSLSFNAIVKDLDESYLKNKKHSNQRLSMASMMSVDLWSKTCSLATKMEEKRAYCTFSKKKIESDLRNNFDEISKVMRLYVELNPEKFPVHERTRDYIFDSKGKLRSTFKQVHEDSHYDVDVQAEYLQNKAVRTSNEYYGNYSDPNVAQRVLLNRLNKIIAKDEPIVSQGDRVERLAQCVRLLRPLQAKRENRSILQYFTNHAVYVMERDTLRMCKAEMKNLGLDPKEISKVLHGGAFNDVKFNDGMTVREKLENQDVKDFVPQNQEVSQVKKEEVNSNRISLIVDDVNEVNDVLDNQIEENTNVKSIEKNVV